MLESLSQSTIKQYEGVFRIWGEFCSRYNINAFEPNENNIIASLTFIYQTKKVGYNTFNTYRSAVMTLIGGLDKSSSLNRFLKGVFRLRPPKRRYNFTWDPQVVLSMLENRYPNESLSLLQLSKKTVTLLALVTGHRLQTLARIRVENITFSDKGLQIFIVDQLKTTKPGKEQPCLE